MIRTPDTALECPLYSGNAPVKLFCPLPLPGHPRDITFWGAAPVSLSLYFFLAPPYINTIIALFSSAPPLFITHIFPLTPGLPWGEDGGRKIWPAHNQNKYKISLVHLLSNILLLFRPLVTNRFFSKSILLFEE